MFEQSLIAANHGARRGWAFGASLIAQAVLIGTALLLPLLFTYKLPLEEWTETLLYLPAPPPPAPPPPPQVKVEPQAAPKRFDEVLTQPKTIPDRVALAEEAAPRVALSAPPAGMENGVIGGIPTNAPALPFLEQTFSKPIMVGGRVQSARLLEQTKPVYPPEALEQQISGVVTLQAIIARDGTIKQLELVSGHPLLATAAIDAVRQWRYKPTVLNGSAVEVQTHIQVNFSILAPPPEPEDSKKKKKRRRR